jgi:hypothetical protein
MTFIATCVGPLDVIGDHLPDRPAAGWLAEQILAERRRDDVGYVFVLRERVHLVFRQSAQRKAIFVRNNGCFLLGLHHTVPPGRSLGLFYSSEHPLSSVMSRRCKRHRRRASTVASSQHRREERRCTTMPAGVHAGGQIEQADEESSGEP